MRLLWISGRVMGKDLAETTEINLASNLGLAGVKTTLVSPGIASNENFDHIRIKRTELPGLETLSAARNLSIFLNSNGDLISNADLVLVDWRYVRPLRRELSKLPTKWAIIDRGPPASSGIHGGRIRRELLRNMQKRFWKEAWGIAGISSCGGFVVSPAHLKLVNGMAGGDLKLFVLPSGTEPNHYLEEKTDPSTLLKLAYIGRIDKKRGLGGIFVLSEILEDNGINHSVVLMGEGDMTEDFIIRTEKDPKFSFRGKLNRNEIRKLLAQQHVGIMPMPDIAVWRISSPIKLAEYAASGMAIVGPSHVGNQLGVGGEWNLLSEGENWMQASASKLVEMIEGGGWEEKIVEGALQASQSYHWEVIAKRMALDIEEMIL